MKKFLIIIGLLLIIGIGWMMFSSGSSSREQVSLEIEKEDTIKPWAITVGLYDPADEPSKLTDLLQSRARAVGFKVVLLQELVDPDAANNKATTILYRPNTEAQLNVFASKMIASSVYRKGLNEAIEQDVIIAAWNISDINWGEFGELAEKYNNPLVAEVSVSVVNAGAEPGKAGELTTFLIDQGFTQAEAINSDEDAPPATRSVLITHQRNYRETAKKVRRILADYGFSGVTYQSDIKQDPNIIITLGPVDRSAEGSIEDEFIEAAE